MGITFGLHSSSTIVLFSEYTKPDLGMISVNASASDVGLDTAAAAVGEPDDVVTFFSDVLVTADIRTLLAL